MLLAFVLISLACSLSAVQPINEGTADKPIRKRLLPCGNAAVLPVAALGAVLWRKKYR
ncbi:MAG TPA: hypothetical protein G4O05_02275 [Caldilineae bacterium]|nr:hypothetical protein [Caldilineae bacterium]